MSNVERGPGGWPVDPQLAFIEATTKLDQARKEAARWRANHAAVVRRLKDQAAVAPPPDRELTRLVEELNQAEKQQLDQEGPLLGRLHQAIAALCHYAGIPNLWNSEIAAEP